MPKFLHAWRDVSHSCGRFYMLSVRNRDSRSMHESPAKTIGYVGYFGVMPGLAL